MKTAGSPRARHALVAVAIGCALLTGCSSTISGQAVRDPDATQLDVPPLAEGDLDDVLVYIEDINDIMGSSTIEVSGELDQMVDHSRDVDNPDCLGAIFGAEQPVYGDSGYTAVRDQVSREPDEDNAHWVEQTAVLYPSADDAQQFFDDSQAMWENCAGTSIGIDDGTDTYTWQIQDVTATDTVLTQITAQDDANGWECQHALSFVSNVTVEVWACSYGAGDEAAEIAAKMVENAAEK
ncbi:sensor domain-containing protein [Mycobacterium sp. C31M]